MPVLTPPNQTEPQHVVELSFGFPVRDNEAMRSHVLLFVLLLGASPLAADPPPPVPVLDLPEIAERISGRYRGRLMEVELEKPDREERRRGVRVVYKAEYLTPGDNRLTLRLDGDTGDFLSVEGVGQTEARIRP